MSTLPIVNVTANVVDASGNPVSGALIVFRLNRSAAVGGVIVPVNVTATTGADGQAVVPLCPNTLCGGAYGVRISADGIPDVRGVAVVPSADCLLDSVFQPVPYPEQSYIETAIAGISDVDSQVQSLLASVSTSPGSGKIPKTGLSGLLDAWISAASTAVAGLVQLATNAVAWAGTSTSQVITAAALWYVLTLATRLRISAPTTIYVSPSGSDTTGDGSSGLPYASIAKALSSIGWKSIDAGVLVTIQCADGDYSIGGTITVDHPDADKIRILGNVSAETAINVASIDTANKKFIVSGDKTAVAGLSSGDKFTVTGSSTAALNRSYTIIGAPVYTGGNTEITVSESIASSTVSGAVITAKPCNKCVLNTSGNIVTFKIAKNLAQLAGFRLNGPGRASGQAIQPCVGAQTIIYKMIVTGYAYGLSSLSSAYTDVQDTLFAGCGYGIFTQGFSKVSCNAGTKVVCDACNYGVTAVAGGKNMVPPSVMTLANSAVADYSPAATGTTNQTLSGAMNIPSATV